MPSSVRARFARFAPPALALVVPWMVSSCCSLGPPPDPRASIAEPVLTIESSDTTRFAARSAFGLPTFEAVEAGGETWVRVGITGLTEGGYDGQPAVPTLNRLLAVPRGARIVVRDARAVPAETRSVRLYPRQIQEGEFSPAFERDGEIPLEEEHWRPPFAMDPDAYRDGLYPPTPVSVRPIGVGRDLSMALIEIAAGQYDSASGELTLFESVSFELAFEGGDGVFLPNEAYHPFEEGSAIAVGATWNQDAVAVDTVYVPPVSSCVGEQLLILTHPAFRSAAERLADSKRGVGWLVSVIDVGGAGGLDTPETIRDFVESRWDGCSVRLSYLLLIGDVDQIPTFTLPRRYKPGDYPTDFPYAQMHADPMADDLVPDLAVGRLAVNSLTEADTVVDKIIAYESTPPPPPFYRRAAIASYFQCCDPAPPDGVENLRRFVQDSEEVRDHLVGRGFTVERIYTTGPAEPGYTGDPTPRFYTDGVTPLPSPLRPEDGYPWSGDTQQVIDAFNAGQVLYFHVDHGGPPGWGHPGFVTGHLSGLTNGARLPLVVSDNCSSGSFDQSNAGFAESILRLPGGGAIGVFAFTRDSNNGVGRRLLQGVVDSLWPDAYPSFGDAIPRLRLGDVLDHARARIAQDAGAPQSQAYLVAWTYVRMLSLFGDPTLAVWRDDPLQLPKEIFEVVVGPVLEIPYPVDGATLTVLGRGPDGGAVPVARGRVEGGRARLPALAAVTDRDELDFFAAAPGAVPSRLVVR